MKTLTALLLMWLFAGFTAFAAEETDEQARFRSYVKQVKCGEILQDIQDPGVRQGVVLIIGSFVSGSNYAKQRISGVDLKGMLLLTEQFCRQNPEASLLQALVTLDLRIDRAAAFVQKERQQ